MLKELFKILFLLTFMIMVSCSNQTNNVTNPLDGNSNIFNLDHSNFDQFVQDHDYLLVYFYLQNSEHCNNFNNIYLTYRWPVKFTVTILHCSD